METDADVARGRRETAGFLVTGLFVALASLRDVYLSGLFQRVSPLHVAVIAFSLATASFLAVTLLRHPAHLGRALRAWRDLAGINATSAVAWIGYFYALGLLEPSLVQVLWAGIGPVAVTLCAKLAPSLGEAPELGRAERFLQRAILVTLALTAAVAVTGLSGAGPSSPGRAALGVLLAIVSGASISVNAVLCRKLNDAGVGPAALVGLRFAAVVVAAAALGAVFPAPLPPAGVAAELALASFLLIVLPVYVNQIGISLASPITVRVVMALGPVAVFLLQLPAGRFALSPWSLACVLTYSALAVGAAAVRHARIRSSGAMATAPSAVDG